MTDTAGFAITIMGAAVVVALLPLWRIAKALEVLANALDTDRPYDKRR